ncbi:deoxynucleoside triphosphate triphosphohydrolase SAMHD1 [Biomphalaria pfeifferi]|uniref:Deoxynucleoside triphosphate triphosphohydrolase SAMHD1 n=1 Tax=Biomphalaria pfeifferi TaxID=112525 RepID=A0AAD8BXS6_BIOPF|nr:deoxynucleoside triphosphate triphosphohydrolase SAMHD1 [Biomphalaria pfeifferi]
MFNDPVHGHIELNEACQLIVDTKEFQRLRDIKQLGFVDFVFPGATHTRFEHALGSYHLAGIFVRRLRDYQNDITITDTDILCVEIAALCHDIGCGPFSALFSKKFIPGLIENNSKLRQRNKLMFEHMLKENQLEDKLKEKFNINPTDLIFIKELIDGYKATGSTMWPYEGRKEKQAFLFEIVQNLRNGIDVCKFDYMARDSQNLGISNNFDFRRYMEFARVMEVDGEKQICNKDKEVGNLYNMFFTRYNLHKFAYQHPVVCGIDEMVLDVLKACNEEKQTLVRINTGEELTMAACLDFENQQNQSGYTRLTDGILFSLRNSDCSKTELIERLYSRDLYKCVFESRPMSKDCLNKIVEDQDQKLKEREKVQKLRKCIHNKCQGRSAEERFKISEDLIRVVITYLDFGMKDENPIYRLRVYSKENTNQATKMEHYETSRLLKGMIYNELRVKVYATCSKTDKCCEEMQDVIREASKECFQNRTELSK